MKRLLAITLLAALSTAAAAQQYPTRPIRVIVPFAAGGPGDFLARTVSPKLTETLGQSIVVDNRGGANGQIATETTAKADHDGYTLLIISAGHTVNATLYPKLPYDSVRDFTPIIRLVSGPAIVVIHPSVSATTVKEFIAYVRERPGKVNFASSGTGAPSHLAVELFKVMTTTDLVHVPYKGMAPGIVDLLGGQVQVAFPTMVAGLVHARAGRLRALAVTSAQRSAAAPDLPTMAEAGIPGYEATNWYGLVGPAKIPPAIVTRLNDELTRILAIPDIRDRLSAQGMDPSSMTPQAFSAYIDSEIGKWARVIKAAHVKAE
jgi:tripartite-type tricarboxylate transporter receptor subunit TctC